MIESAVEWYCSNYLKLKNTESYKRKDDISLEHFVRAMENKVMAKGTSVLNSPVKIEWHITKRCNLSCSFCYSSASNGDFTELDTTEMLSIICQMHELNVLEVQIEGGEPFLRQDLDILLREIKKRYVRIRLLTNGTVLNRKVMSTIAEIFNSDDVVQISIHGHDERTHDYNVGTVGAFSKVEAFLNLAECMEIPIRASCVVSNKNIGSLREIVEYLSKFRCVENFVMQPIIPVGRGDIDAIVPSIKLLLEYYKLSKIDTPMQLSMLLGHAYDIPEFARYVLENGIQETRVFCAASRARLHIDEKGNVYPCHFLAYPAFYLGNIQEQTIEEIWSGVANRKVQGYSREVGDCDNCKLKMHCTKKGLCTSYLDNERLNAKPINCFVEVHQHG